MPTDDRDQQFERALARHLSNASPDSACPEAETLAAFHERTLSPEEMARHKQHIAGCPRCQETLALVEQTEYLPVEEWEHQNEPEPVEQMALPQAMAESRVGLQQNQEPRLSAPVGASSSAQISKMRARPNWRWLVPVGAIAASVIVLIGVHEIRNQHVQQLENSQLAQNRQQVPQLTSPQSGALERDRREEEAAQKPDQQTPSQQPPAALPPPMITTPSAHSTPQLTNEPIVAGKRKDASPAIVGGNAQPPRPYSPVSGYLAKSIPKESAARSANVAVSSGAAADSLAEKKAENEQVRVPASSQSVEAQPAPAVSNAASSQAEVVTMRNAVSLLQLAADDRRYIVAPGEKHAWLVGDTGKIERTTDRGKTWKPQTSGVTADLTGGSATSDKICWVIGKAGTLLLTTDGGKHWKLLSSPIAEDLGGIHATDAVHASIWDVPNRKSFETNDAGVTWHRIANE
jgi:hypothetical protein